MEGDRYYLRGDWEADYKEVSKQAFMDAESHAGFRSKFKGEPATSGFNGKGVEGIVIDKDDKRGAGWGGL